MVYMFKIGGLGSGPSLKMGSFGAAPHWIKNEQTRKKKTKQKNNKKKKTTKKKNKAKKNKTKKQTNKKKTGYFGTKNNKETHTFEKGRLMERRRSKKWGL